MPVTVVTDSSCDLPPDLVQQWGLRIVPCGISFGDRAYRDGVDIDRDEFYQMLTTGNEFPTTSQPSVAEFLELFTALREDGQDIVAVHLSAKLSATMNSANQAKSALDANGPIDILDSEQTSMGLGLIALEAAMLASQGASREDVAARVRQLKPRASVFCLIDTLEYLRRGGRAGRAQSFLASALQIKPILTITDGEASPVSRPRTRRKGVDELVARVQQRGGVERVSVLHSTGPEDAEALGQRIASATGIEAIPARFGAVLGSHLGPRALGVALTTSG